MKRGAICQAAKKGGIRLNFSPLSLAEMIVFCLVVNCYPPHAGREEGSHTLLVFLSLLYWEQCLVLSLIFMDIRRKCREELQPFYKAMSGWVILCLYYIHLCITTDSNLFTVDH